jgi:hypothetical protein
MVDRANLCQDRPAHRSGPPSEMTAFVFFVAFVTSSFYQADAHRNSVVHKSSTVVHNERPGLSTTNGDNLARMPVLTVRTLPRTLFRLLHQSW